MREPQTREYFNLLEIVSKINDIIDQHKDVDTTLNQTIKILQVLENAGEPSFFRIVFDQKEFRTKHFSTKDHC